MLAESICSLKGLGTLIYLALAGYAAGIWNPVGDGL